MHATTAGWVVIVKTVKMEQTVHEIKAQLVRERSLVGLGLPLRGFDADENLAVLEGDDIRRSLDLHKAAMKFADFAIGNQKHNDLLKTR